MPTKGNPTIQVRLHPDVIAKASKRAIELGYITSTDQANLAEYVRNLILRDINSHGIIIDGENANYSVE